MGMRKVSGRECGEMNWESGKELLTVAHLCGTVVGRGGFPGGIVIKNPPATAGDKRDAGLIPAQEDPWKRKWQPTVVFSSKKFVWTEEPGELQYMGSQRVGQDWACTHTHSFLKEVFQRYRSRKLY